MAGVGKSGHKMFSLLNGNCLSSFDDQHKWMDTIPLSIICVLLYSIIVDKVQWQNVIGGAQFSFSLAQSRYNASSFHTFISLNGLRDPSTDGKEDPRCLPAHHSFSFLTHYLISHSFNIYNEHTPILCVPSLYILQQRCWTLSFVQYNFWLILHLDHMVWDSDCNHHTIQ